MTMALLEARGLTKAFGSVMAANHMSVSIAEREVIGIIGANGAGKTTFVNMVTGYLKPDSGTIHYEGREITRLSPREITQLGVSRSFQVPQLFGSLSLAENLLLALGVAQERHPRFWRPLVRPELSAAADEMIGRYGLHAYRDQKVALLPQGVRKLLDIAMATAHKDVVMGALKETGVTVMFIEHDMDIVERFSQRLLAFAEGTVLADGPPAQVLAEGEVRRLVVGEVLHRVQPPPGGGGHA
jgi:branched-chain amino acid transport system ATP-binding protein